MKHQFIICLGLLVMPACGPDETISGYADPDATYVLATVDDIVFDAPATIEFADQGEVSGTGPCNTYTATQLVPYPWFELGPIAGTRRACADLERETDYFTALSEMRFAEVVGDTLILTSEAGKIMVFQGE